MTATLRWLAGTRITGAVPCLVIQETGDTVALFQPAGSMWRRANGVRLGPRGRNMLDGDWDGTHSLLEWLGLGVLRVHRFGRPWSVWRWLDSERKWSGDFYVNLEDPWRRTPIGFDSGDWILDVVARGDRSWRYKDEDELAWVESTGAVSAEWAQRARAAGTAAIADIEAWAWPFSANWDQWAPPISANLPILSSEWTRVDEPGSGA
jgi:hypothetical protein